MYNILVVDDEPLSADGISSYLKENGLEDWNILFAYSSQQGLEIAGGRIDILLTDITMPNIDGYELYRRIRERWPRCKVIYLTGNVSPQYAQKAIRETHAGTQDVIDYILKTEKESVILNAVYNAIEMLNNELRSLEFQESMREQIRLALPVLRKEYLLSFLRSEGETARVPGGMLWERKQKFIQLEINLDSEKDILLIYGGVEASKNTVQHDLELVSMDAVMQMTLNDMFRWYYIQIESSRFVYFIQTKNTLSPMESKKISSLLLPYMELVQESMSRINIDLSLILDTG
jgi:two-component system response regulator YesN